MKNKKGMELSLTVIVLIILSIIIFMGGIALVWKFFAGAEELKAGIELKTKEQIEALLRQGTDLVAIPVNTKILPIGKEAMFGLGVRSTLQGKHDFFVQLAFDGIYTKRGKTLPGIAVDPSLAAHIEQVWLGGFKEQGPIAIEHNAFEVIPLRVRAGRTINEGLPTPKGAIVVFNVCVCADNPCGECELNTPVYEKIKQVSIETV